MSKENSDNSPFYWLNLCEGVSERITDLLDADVHRPGEGGRHISETKQQAARP